MIGCGKLLKVVPGLQPIPIWAIGCATIGGLVRPIVFHKPVGQAWQLQYVGAELPGAHTSVKFNRGFRRRSDTEGLVYVSCRYTHTTTASNYYRVAAVSSDHGETWSYIGPGGDFADASQYNDHENMGAICVTPGGSICVCTGGSTSGSFGTPIILNGSGSLDFATVPTTFEYIGEFLSLSADDSPTEAEVLLLATFDGVLKSVNDGATWTIHEDLTGGQGGTFARIPGRRTVDDQYLLSGGNGFPAATSRVWRTSDFDTWEEFETGVAGTTTYATSVAARNERQWFATHLDTSSEANPLNLARTFDEGVTWSGTIPAGMTLIRFLGNRYFGLRILPRYEGTTTSLRESVNGLSWSGVTLPTIPGASDLIINDIFG